MAENVPDWPHVSESHSQVRATEGRDGETNKELIGTWDWTRQILNGEGWFGVGFLG